MSINTHTGKLAIETDGAVALLTLRNPPANTWDEDTLSALPRILAQIEADPDLYILILTGEGDRFFSAGADLKLFADGDAGQARKMARLFGRAFEALASFDGLTIAAINGYAMGGGLESALACDLRIAETTSVLALPEASVGLLPCAGGTQLLPLLVGEGWAKRMILLGERVTGNQALEIGLIEACADSGHALSMARDWARLALQQSPPALRACKRLVQASRDRPLKQALADERESFVDLFDTEDQAEGVRAFLAKRRPQWKNR